MTRHAVLIHGAGGNASIWADQASALAAAGYEPLTVDLPGHGDSEGEPSTTIAGYTGWLMAYLAHLDEPVHLVGHSMGGLIALETAAALPDTVRSVTMLGMGDTMPVNERLFAGSHAGDPKLPGLMADWMHARERISLRS